MHKSKFEKCLPEQQLGLEPKLKLNTPSQTIAKPNVSRRCWIVGADVDTGNIRPAYVTKKDAAELQVKGYEDYQSCLDEAKRVAAEWGRTCG